MVESNTEGDPMESTERNKGGGGDGVNGDGNGGDKAVDLLEEAWFFGNLLHRNRKITRCLSDPCPSSSSPDYASSGNSTPEPNVKPGKEPPVCVPGGETSPNLDIRRSPPSKKLIQDCSSSPTSSFFDDQSGRFNSASSSTTTEKSMSEVWEEARRAKASDGNTESELRRRSPRPALLRAPSLPPCIGREDVRGIGERLQANSHPRMSKSNRQSSLNVSDFLPRRLDSKGMSSYRSQISSEEDMRRRLLNRTKSIKSRGELEYEELQGFKDLGFTFDNKDISPKIVNIIPGLQEKQDRAAEEAEADENQRKPYLSEAWLSKNFAPPIPKWSPSPSGSGKEDVKAHIKFWARAVASNVVVCKD